MKKFIKNLAKKIATIVVIYEVKKIIKEKVLGKKNKKNKEIKDLKKGKTSASKSKKNLAKTKPKIAKTKITKN